jgi:hypothetical protein
MNSGKAINTGKWIRAAFFVVLAAFFWSFHHLVLRAHFGSDEMMNLYGHWRPPLWRTIAAEFWFWSKTVRPMGALYYLPLYSLFGLNPAPFNFVRCLILLVNTVVFLLVAKLIGRSWWIATLAAFAIAYQSNIGNLHYDGAFIYDVLCGGFYFAALFYYLRCRRVHLALGVRQVCVFLALYICALNSKEMAVSLPVLVIVYEFLFEGRKAKIGPALVAAAVTAVFVWGKLSGPGTLTTMDSYRPVFTWERFADSNTRILNQLFYTDVFTMSRVLQLWAVLLYIGLRNWGLRKFDPRWLFLLAWVVITPLPIGFLPNRGGATLYIVCGGWAMMAALAARAVLRLFARQPVAGLPRKAIITAGLVACIAAYWHETQRSDDRLVPYYLKNGEDTAQAIAAVQALGVRPAPHSSVVFLNSPFPEYYDTLFIAALVWKDPTIEIWLQNKHPTPDSVLAQSKYVFDYVNGNFVDASSSRYIR